MQRFLCNIEKPHPDFGVCFLPASVTDKIVACARDKDHVPHMEANVSRRLMSLVTSVHPQIMRQPLTENMLFRPGHLIERNGYARDPTPLDVWVDGLALDQVLSGESPSLE